LRFPVGELRSLTKSVENAPGIRHFNHVKPLNFFALLLAVGLLAGCQKTETVIAPQPIDNGVPTHAQAKLPTMKIYLGAETLDAELALTPEQEQTGMMFRTNVTDESAMLFVLSRAMHAPEGFWMTNCPVSLSAAYISPDGVIQEIHHLEKNDATPVLATTDNIVFVLETSDGWFERHNVNTGTVIRTEKGSLADTFLRR
jgi:uncharacterized protein